MRLVIQLYYRHFLTRNKYKTHVSISKAAINKMKYRPRFRIIHTIQCDYRQGNRKPNYYLYKLEYMYRHIKIDPLA